MKNVTVVQHKNSNENVLSVTVVSAGRVATNLVNLLIHFTLSSLHLNDTERYCYFLLGPEFLHQIDNLTGYCIAFCRHRCADLAHFSLTLAPYRTLHRTSSLRSLDRLLFSVFSLFSMHITFCVYLTLSHCLPLLFPSLSPSCPEVIPVLKLTFPQISKDSSVLVDHPIKSNT